ncbi:MAG: hypothetical protein RSC92_05255, partial [Clostridia bacterium]
MIYTLLFIFFLLLFMPLYIKIENKYLTIYVYKYIKVITINLIKEETIKETKKNIKKIHIDIILNLIKKIKIKKLYL